MDATHLVEVKVVTISLVLKAPSSNTA